MLKEDIQMFIERPEESKYTFNELAVQLFGYLYRENEAYQQFCRRIGIGSRQVRTWKDIPAVSTDAFKNTFLSTVPGEDCERIFMTSGTTSGKQGKHYHENLDIYDFSARNSFQQFVSREKRPIAILFPDEEEMPNSSLAHYLTMLREYQGTKDSRHFFTRGGLKVQSFIQWTKEYKDTPVIVLGASYSFVHLFDALEEIKQTLPLHKDSLIFDTGGFKNISRSLEEEEFYEKLEQIFHVKRENMVNMYGMTELSTQYYTAIGKGQKHIKKNPHWIRFKVVDPVSGEEMPKGEAGLLIHVDLANINSVPAVQTSDLAVEHETGFELLGRQASAEPKGCSLSAKQWLEEHNHVNG
ncbi:Acyl-protein synthetase, LuxE [Oceanobacillus oncorhynchi]|uniref:Acyl-protein synthetase, LuxE n=1 Tax=Oceanobacillus oncorhynchi TaxID=545501 RepID=A0A0A1MM54_9BACI|nr:Acyl-protein synthetase, LuxE [Oceanobacillus oncorhynchi]